MLSFAILTHKTAIFVLQVSCDILSIFVFYMTVALLLLDNVNDVSWLYLVLSISLF